MKRIFLLIGLAALPNLVGGCGGTCGTYCEYTLVCLEDEIDGCDFDDIDELRADCEDECGQAVDRLNGDEKGEFDACINCVADEIGAADECNDGDYGDAINDCDNECEERGIEEFFEDFDFEIRESDLDC
jgi:hypothetical protein